jgi:hypothetical protein
MTKTRYQPLRQALVDLIGDDGEGRNITSLLTNNGITTPEELRKSPYAHIKNIQGMSRGHLKRLSEVRDRLRLAYAGTTQKGDPDGEEQHRRARID